MTLLDSNKSTREENALSELVELAFTQIIRLAMTERRWSDSSISFHQLSGFAFLFMGSYSMWCNRPRMALDGRKSTYLRGVGATLPLASISLAGSPLSSWAPIPSDVTVHHGLGWPELPTCSVTSRIHFDRRIACKIVQCGPLPVAAGRGLSKARLSGPWTVCRPAWTFRLRRSCRGRCGPALLLVQDCLFVHISVVRCMSFSWPTHPEVRAFFALSHLASWLTTLFGELATGLHVHQMLERCFINLLASAVPTL